MNDTGMVEIKWKLFHSNLLNQFLAALTVNIISFAHGSAMGWTSPFLPLLESIETPLNNGPLSKDEVSWIGSLLCVGGLFGVIWYGFISDKFGKKFGLMLMATTNIAFWLCVLFGTNVYYLYAGRILAGSTGGGILRTVPLYIADIADNKIRGTLGSLLILSLNIGILNIYIVGSYITYSTVPMIMICFPVIFLILMWFLPDTPQNLLKKKQINEAKRALKFYRNAPSEKAIETEFEKLKKSIENESKTISTISLKDFLECNTRNGLAVGMFLMILNQMSGSFVIITYSVTIFQQTGSNISPKISAIFIGVIQILGVIVSFILVDKVGRKILLTVSALGTGIGLAAMSFCSYLIATGVESPYLNFSPVISLSLAIFMAFIGILTLPFIVVAELLPQKMRGIGSTICMATVTTSAFIASKVFPVLLGIIDVYGLMAIFSGACFTGGVVIILVLPETKGKDMMGSDAA